MINIAQPAFIWNDLLSDKDEGGLSENNLEFFFEQTLAELIDKAKQKDSFITANPDYINRIS